jgi:hypothetical protein
MASDILPAFCPQHGLFSIRSPIGFGAGSKAIFSNNVTRCPQCGSQSEILSGQYSFGLDGLNILADGSNSREFLLAIQRLAERAKRGEISPEQAKTEAEKLSPSAGKLFDVRNWSDDAKATFYAAIVIAVGTIIAARTTPAPTQTVTVQSIEYTGSLPKQKLKSSTAITPIPTPKPRPKEPR